MPAAHDAAALADREHRWQLAVGAWPHKSRPSPHDSASLLARESAESLARRPEQLFNHTIDWSGSRTPAMSRSATASANTATPAPDDLWIDRDKLARIERLELVQRGLLPPALSPTYSDDDFNPAENLPPARSPSDSARSATSLSSSRPPRAGSRIPVPRAAPSVGSSPAPPHASSPEDHGLSNSRSQPLLTRAPSGPVTPGTPGTPGSVTPRTRRPRVGSNARRPGTSSGSSRNTPAKAARAPEGDPPWLDAFRPDPRLPPEEQVLPTIAKRQAQEKWKKEGVVASVYDANCDPLNDNDPFAGRTREHESDSDTGTNLPTQSPDSKRLSLTDNLSRTIPSEHSKENSAYGKVAGYKTVPSVKRDPESPNPWTSPRIVPGTATCADGPIPAPAVETVRLEPIDNRKAGCCGLCVVM